MSDLDLADPSTGSSQVQPDILIGLDHYWKFVTGEMLHQGNGPVALHTTLGWVLSGPIPLPATEDSSHSTNLVTHVLRVGASSSEDNRRLENQLKAFWELESLGILDTETSL